MKTTYVLGLDVSMNSTGWAVLSVKGNIVRYVDSGIIKVNTKKPHSKRLTHQREEFQRIVDEYPVTYVARESGFARFIKATQVLFKAYGVAEEFFSDKDIVEYAASSIKKVVTGNGKATKGEVEKAVTKELNIKKKFKSDDESDAVAVALTLINNKKLIKGDK